MKVYIAGKITGDPNYLDKFNGAAKRLKHAGNIVLNPATLPGGMARSDYMRICLAMIEAADTVVFLPDWVDSEGAALEHGYCRYTGKTISYL